MHIDRVPSRGNSITGIILHLLQGLNSYLDRYFTSITFAELLERVNTGIIGTIVKKNRKHIAVKMKHTVEKKVSKFSAGNKI